MVACRIVGKDSTKPFSRVYYEDVVLDANQMRGAGTRGQMSQAFRHGMMEIVLGTSQVVLLPKQDPDFELNARSRGWKRISEVSGFGFRFFQIYVGKTYDVKIGPLYFTIEAVEFTDEQAASLKAAETTALEG